MKKDFITVSPDTGGGYDPSEHSQIKFLELPRRNSGIFFGYSNLSTTFVASIN